MALRGRAVWAVVRAVMISAGLLAVGACTPGADGGLPSAPVEPSTSTPVATTSTHSAYETYVALGDSYTAAPYVPSTDLADGCLRSDGNYPSLVAAELGVTELIDVSCSGAQTRHLHEPQNTFRSTRVAPQLDALTDDTDLVTLSIGGNDFDLFGNLLQTCTRMRGRDPQGSPCADWLVTDGVDLETELRRIGDRVTEALHDVRERSPEAKLVLVGYPRIVPEDGTTCPRIMPLADGDYRLAERVARSLDRELREAANQSGVDYIDMYAASEGHDVCAEEPWVNGRVTDQSAALMYHPFAAEQRAAADLVLAGLR